MGRGITSMRQSYDAKSDNLLYTVNQISLVAIYFRVFVFIGFIFATAELDYTRTMYSMSIWPISWHSFLKILLFRENKSEINWFTVFPTNFYYLPFEG